jgi:hypothetical protein
MAHPRQRFSKNWATLGPAEQRAKTRVVYASQLMLIAPETVTEKLTLVVPGGGEPTSGGILVCETTHPRVVVATCGGASF